MSDSETKDRIAELHRQFKKKYSSDIDHNRERIQFNLWPKSDGNLLDWIADRAVTVFVILIATLFSMIAAMGILVIVIMLIKMIINGMAGV